jgi:predicted RNA-binding Zn-ribbon protein involved in translation (DUF1610 family)
MNENAIDRKLVCAFIDGLISDDGEREKGLEYIRNMPPVNPTKTGHWIVDRDDSRRWDKVRFYCSECGKWQTYGKTDYCPSCGAKMIEPQERSGEKCIV